MSDCTTPLPRLGPVPAAALAALAGVWMACAPVGHAAETVPEAVAAGEATPAAAAGDAPGARSVLVRLDGTGSYDPENENLSYRWTQIEGPEVALSDPAAARPHFRTHRPGVYRFSLVVSDGAETSDPAVVTVRVERPNSPPEAIAPLGLETEVGVPVAIDGSKSRDADADAVTYRWRQVAGPPLFLDADAIHAAKLEITPARPGVYEFELVVYDGQEPSRPARTRLVVRPPNRAPRADAGPGQTVRIEPPAGRAAPEAPRDAPVAMAPQEVVAQPGRPVVLDASRSYSPRGRPLRYYWQQRGGPFVEAFERVDGAESRLRFVPPELGTYAFSLIVSDGEYESPPRRVQVQVVEGNAPPVAQIRAPRRANVDERIELDGAGSYDRENRTLEYHWRQAAGPRILEVGLTERDDPAVAVFTPREPGAYVFELTVGDGELLSKPVRAAVLVQKPNQAPRVETVDRITCAPGEAFALQARGEDPEGAPLAYTWRQVGGPPLLEKDAPQRELRLVAAEPGVYRFEATAHDGRTASAPARCEVTVAHPNAAPIPVAKGLVQAWVGEPVTLDARASTDAEGDELSYAWRVSEDHPQTTYRLLDARTAEAFFTPLAPGDFVVELRVSDGASESEPLRITVRARDRASLPAVALTPED